MLMRVNTEPVGNNPNFDKYGKDVRDLAYTFSKKIYEEMGDLVKCIVLFGSAAKGKTNSKSDIDILVVVDDLQIFFTKEVANTYGLIIKRVVSDVSFRLHVTSLKLSDFWDYTRAGDPVAINVLRDGVALLDTGFFDPLRALLVRGKIRPSKESIWNYFARAPKTLYASKSAVLKACFDLYWAVIDSAHAALMQHGKIPPSPDNVAEMLDDVLVKTKKLDKKYVETMNFFYDLQKKITYRDIKFISGKEYDSYLKRAEAFVDKMESFIIKK